MATSKMKFQHKFLHILFRWDTVKSIQTIRWQRELHVFKRLYNQTLIQLYLDVQFKKYLEVKQELQEMNEQEKEKRKAKRQGKELEFLKGLREVIQKREHPVDLNLLQKCFIELNQEKKNPADVLKLLGISANLAKEEEKKEPLNWRTLPARKRIVQNVEIGFKYLGQYPSIEALEYFPSQAKIVSVLRQYGLGIKSVHPEKKEDLTPDEISLNYLDPKSNNMKIDQLVDRDFKIFQERQQKLKETPDPVDVIDKELQNEEAPQLPDITRHFKNKEDQSTPAQSFQGGSNASRKQHHKRDEDNEEANINEITEYEEYDTDNTIDDILENERDGEVGQKGKENKQKVLENLREEDRYLMSYQSHKIEDPSITTTSNWVTNKKIIALDLERDQLLHSNSAQLVPIPERPKRPILFLYKNWNTSKKDPFNNKAIMIIRVYDLNLTSKVTERLILLAGPRFNPKTEKIKLTEARFQSRAENFKHLKLVFQRLLDEAYTACPFYVSCEDRFRPPAYTIQKLTHFPPYSATDVDDFLERYADFSHKYDTYSSLDLGSIHEPVPVKKDSPPPTKYTLFRMTPLEDPKSDQELKSKVTFLSKCLAESAEFQNWGNQFHKLQFLKQLESNIQQLVKNHSSQQPQLQASLRSLFQDLEVFGNKILQLEAEFKSF